MHNKEKKELTELKEKVKKKDTIFSRYIKDRIFRQNKHFFMIIVGGLGSGKSYSALRLCENLDESFTIDRCCFRAKEFILKVDNLISLGEQNKQDVKGQVLMWDELGVEHNAREFMTISNRAINYFFQTCRSLNLIFIMTVPYLSYVDSATRKLANCIAETKGINHRKKQVTLKIKFLQVAPFTGKEYPKYLRYVKNNKQFVLKKIKVPMPSPELCEQYENKKSGFNKELRDKLIRMLDKVEQKENEQSLDKPQERKPLTEKQERVMKVLANIKESNRYEVARKILGISLSSIHQNKTLAEKKGYTLEEFAENVE